MKPKPKLRKPEPRSCFFCSSGNVTDEVIKAYIEQQRHDASDFRVEGEEAPTA